MSKFLSSKLSYYFVLLIAFLYLFYVPIAFYITKYAVDYILLIILVIVFSNKLHKNDNIMDYVFIILSFLAIYIFQYYIMNINTSFHKLAGFSRKHIYGYCFPILIFFILKDRNLQLRIIKIIYLIICFDIIFGFVSFHLLKIGPEVFHKWSFHFTTNKSVIFEGYLPYKLIPTLFGYPYPHVEALIHAFFTLILFAKTMNKNILVLSVIVQALLFIKTTMLGLVFLIFIYIIIKNRRLLPIFLIVLSVLISVFSSNIEKVIEFYGGFTWDVFYEKFLLYNIDRYFSVVEIKDIIFGNYIFRENNIGMSEIRLFSFFVESGLIVFFLLLLLNLYPILLSFQEFVRTKSTKSLFFIFAVLIVLIDSLHYFFYFHFQGLFFIMFGYIFIVNDLKEGGSFNGTSSDSSVYIQ